jgi:hypothetical protein
LRQVNRQLGLPRPGVSAAASDNASGNETHQRSLGAGVLHDVAGEPQRPGGVVDAHLVGAYPPARSNSQSQSAASSRPRRTWELARAHGLHDDALGVEVLQAAAQAVHVRVELVQTQVGEDAR